MREILFRGKTVNGGEWVQGSLFAEGTSFEIIRGTCNNLGIEGVDVVPDTIGQFTGIIDEIGKKVFEGDILDCITADFDGSDKFVQYIVTDITNFEQMGFLDFCHKIEVVGNIHRTPQNDEVRE